MPTFTAVVVALSFVTVVSLVFGIHARRHRIHARWYSFRSWVFRNTGWLSDHPPGSSNRSSEAAREPIRRILVNPSFDPKTTAPSLSVQDVEDLRSNVASVSAASVHSIDSAEQTPVASAPPCLNSNSSLASTADSFRTMDERIRRDPVPA